MLIKPYTDEQIFQLELLQQINIYKLAEFVITRSEQKKSDKGNDMFVLDMDIYQDGYKKLSTRDYIVFNTEKHFSELKVKRFYQSIGREQEYMSGNVNAELLARIKAKGACKLKNEEYVNDKGEKRTSVKVDFYVKPEDVRPALDDDLPNL